MSNRNKIRTLLIEDQALICDALGQMLHHAPIGDAAVLEIVALARTGEDGVALFKELTPDLILLDLLMPGMSGLETLAKLRECSAASLIVVLTAQLNPALVEEAKALGANGYHLKNTTQEQLLGLIGEVTRSPAKFVGPSYESNDEAPLTPRERDVLILLVDGCTNRDVAGTLNISVRTVEKHRENISRKLGYLSLASMKKEAQRLGLLG